MATGRRFGGGKVISSTIGEYSGMKNILQAIIAGDFSLSKR
jgi:hypothetical protein